MCRRNHLLGCAIAAFGLGLVLGHCSESAFFSIWGGTALLIFGFVIIRSNHRF